MLGLRLHYVTVQRVQAGSQASYSDQTLMEEALSYVASEGNGTGNASQHRDTLDTMYIAVLVEQVSGDVCQEHDPTHK